MVSKVKEENKLRDSLFKLTHEIKNPIAVCKGYLDMLDTNNTKKVPTEAGTTYTYYDADGTSHTDTSVIYYKDYVTADSYQAKIEYYPHLASYDLTTPYQKQDGYVLGENAKQYYFI